MSMPSTVDAGAAMLLDASEKRLVGVDPAEAGQSSATHISGPFMTGDDALIVFPGGACIRVREVPPPVAKAPKKVKEKARAHPLILSGYSGKLAPCGRNDLCPCGRPGPDGHRRKYKVCCRPRG